MALKIFDSTKVSLLKCFAIKATENFFLYGFLILTSCNPVRQTQFGDYKAKSGGAIITLRSDSTFTYRKSRHLNTVNAIGVYHMKLDTVFFVYNDRNYDSLVSVGQLYIPLKQALGLPGQYIWKENKLFMLYGANKKKTYAKRIK
jgi:hypothetical protein